MENIRNIIESLLFVADEPLTVAKLKSVLETIEAKEITTALHALADQYEARGGGFSLSEVAGGWQLRSRPEYNEWIKRLLQPSPQRLSKAALETLAIVAYNQPIIRVDIEHIRGVDCGGILRQLLERKLIRVLGRKEIPGRPLIYATTKLFLEMFDLKDLKDLPTPKEMEEMGVSEEARVNQGLENTMADRLGLDADRQHTADDAFIDNPSLFDLYTPSLFEPADAGREGIRYSRPTATCRPQGATVGSGPTPGPHGIPGHKPKIAQVLPHISANGKAAPLRWSGAFAQAFEKSKPAAGNSTTVENDTKTAGSSPAAETEKP
jgi:segregation and condensation protein B